MMRFNNLFKSAVIALPLLVLAACSSDQSATDQSANNTGTTTQSTTDNSATSQSSADQAQAQLQQLQQNNTVYFGFDQYDVSPDFSSVLDGHADYLRNNANAHVIVQGYTDERGTPEYNIALGERRANAVKMYLQSKGVPANQISTVSYGKEKPAVLGHDETAYSKNRRAVLVYNQ